MEDDHKHQWTTKTNQEVEGQTTGVVIAQSDRKFKYFDIYVLSESCLSIHSSVLLKVWEEFNFGLKLQSSL